MEFHPLPTNKQENPHLLILIQSQSETMHQRAAKDLNNPISKNASKKCPTNCVTNHLRKGFFHSNCNNSSSVVTTVGALHFDSSQTSVTCALLSTLLITPSHQCMVNTNPFMISHQGANFTFEWLVFSKTRITPLVMNHAKMNSLCNSTVVTNQQRKSNQIKHLVKMTCLAVHADSSQPLHNCTKLTQNH